MLNSNSGGLLFDRTAEHTACQRFRVCVILAVLAIVIGDSRAGRF
jgi:hypothetical protein